jgi:hypothetical protein
MSPFHDSKPENLITLELMKKCAKIAGMGNRDLGRIQAQNGQERPLRFQIENGSQKGGYYNEPSECEIAKRPSSKRWFRPC